MENKTDYQLDYVDITFKLNDKNESLKTKRIYYNQINDITLNIEKNYPYADMNYLVIVELPVKTKIIHFPDEDSAKEFYYELWSKKHNPQFKNEKLDEIEYLEQRITYITNDCNTLLDLNTNLVKKYNKLETKYKKLKKHYKMCSKDYSELDIEMNKLLVSNNKLKNTIDELEKELKNVI